MVLFGAFIGAVSAVTSFLSCPLPFMCSNNKQKTPCYPPRGCFSRTGDFDHFLFDPKSPIEINVKFKLVTRKTLGWTNVGASVGGGGGSGVAGGGAGGAGGGAGGEGDYGFDYRPSGSYGGWRLLPAPLTLHNRSLAASQSASQSASQLASIPASDDINSASGAAAVIPYRYVYLKPTSGRVDKRTDGPTERPTN